jgi:hypothetical protein
MTLHMVNDADRPDLEKAKEKWARINRSADPPLE